VPGRRRALASAQACPGTSVAATTPQLPQWTDSRIVSAAMESDRNGLAHRLDFDRRSPRTGAVGDQHITERAGVTGVMFENSAPSVTIDYSAFKDRYRR